MLTLRQEHRFMLLHRFGNSYLTTQNQICGHWAAWFTRCAL